MTQVKGQKVSAVRRHMSEDLLDGTVTTDNNTVEYA